MKKRVIKDFNNLPDETREEIRKQYPHGYLNHIITFFNKDKLLISALPYETEEISYLIKMPTAFSLGDDETEDDSTIEVMPGQEPLEGLNDEKYLVQEEEEEESD